MRLGDRANEETLAPPEPAAGEELQREQAELYRVTLACIGDAVLTTDAEGRVTFLNGVAAALTGWTPEEAVGQSASTVFRIVNEETGAPVQSPLVRVLREGVTVGLANHTVLIARDGTRYPVEDSGAPIRIGERIVGAVLVFRDATDRRRQQRELEEREAQFRTLAESIPQLAWMANPDGHIFWYNRRWYEYTGTTPEEMEGWGWQSVHDPAVLPEVLDRWKASIASGEPFDMIFPLRGQDGVFRPFLTRVMPVRDAEGRVTRWFGTNTDVTEAKAAEEQLRASEERLRLATEAAELGIWVWLPAEDEVVWENDQPYEIFGLPRTAEPLTASRFVSEFLHPDDVAAFQQAVAEALRTGDRFFFQGRFWRPDGELRWCEFTGRVQPSSTGAPLRLVGTVADITERKRAAERLQEETHTVETVNRVGRVLAAELDLERLVQALTDAATELSGAQFGSFFYNVLDEQGGKYMLYTLSGAPREAFSRFPMPRATEIFLPTFQGEGVIRSEDITQDPRYGKNAPYHGMPEGHLPVRSYLAVPVASRSGEVLGALFFGHAEPGVFTERAERIVVGIASQAAIALDNARLFQQAATELAERKRAEALLTAQRSILEQVARGTPLPELLEALVRMVERQSEGTLCSILLLDEQCRLRHGAAPSLPASYNAAIDGVVIGPSVGSCGTAAYRRERVVVGDIAEDPLWDEFRELALSHGLRACWSTPICSSEDTVLGSIAMYSREPGQPSERDQELTEMAARLAGIAIERARAEEALRQRAQELAEMDRQKDEFLAMLAHELRNPLAPVLNAVQVLQAPGAEEPVKQRQHAVIDRQARQMARLLDDLLDVARITRGKIELRPQPVELGALVEQAVEAARPLLEQRQQQIHLAVSPVPLCVQADPTRMHQIVSNLLSNAAKYTPAGGRISLTVAPDGDQALIRVADTGMGIAPELLPRVFDLFVQDDRSVSRGESGLGIGLTMVQRLVQLHGGSVQANSDGPGRGSEFTVRLPLRELPQSTSRGAEPTTPAGAGAAARRVLIVDDNRDAAETLVDLARLWGHEVRAVFDGPSALRTVPEYRPEIMLLDISMPGMSGYEVARSLHEQASFNGTLLVALTGYGQEEDRRRTREAGFHRHLTKPVDPDALRRLLDESDTPQPG